MSLMASSRWSPCEVGVAAGQELRDLGVYWDDW